MTTRQSMNIRLWIVFRSSAVPRTINVATESYNYVTVDEFGIPVESRIFILWK